MRALTTRELADIILQRPERITAGILDRRSTFERIRDEALTIKDHRFAKPHRAKGFESLRQKLLLHFEDEARVAQEHPRSLKKAALELKTLGFSNLQIQGIKELAYRFLLTYCERNFPLDEVLTVDHPGHTYSWCDDAFLGAALTESYNNSPGTSEDLDTLINNISTSRNNVSKNANTIFAPKWEEKVCDLFRRYVDDDISDRPDSLKFLQPATPRASYERLFAPA